MNELLKNMIEVFKSNWSSYRYRFSPFMPWFLPKQRRKRCVSSKNDKILSDEILLDNLLKLFFSFHQCSNNNTKGFDLHEKSLLEMEKIVGFSIHCRRSSIQAAGTGVFVSGQIKAGSLVALYPGTIYILEPILLASIHNSYIFRCSDGLYIDGKSNGLSGRIYKSCVYRDLRYPFFPADLSWLSGNLINPLNCGQYINNETAEFPANVAYQEYSIPLDKIPIELRCCLPNIYYNNNRYYCDSIIRESNYLRIVALVATKDIVTNSELFSTYYTIIHDAKE